MTELSDTVIPATLHACPVDPECRYCNGSVTAAERLDWSFLDAAYCICLKSRDDRASEAAAEFHRTGLCAQMIFYRPEKHPERGIAGSWESHRAIASLAVEHAFERTLICEDDVVFDAALSPGTLRRIAAQLDRLNDEWRIFHLGHWPLRAFLVTAHVLRTASACAHAYIISPVQAQWLSDRPYGTEVPMNRGVGKALDAAFAVLPDVYAYFPMIAIQRVSRSDNFATTARPQKRLRHLVTRSRHREWLLSNLMRPSEAFVIMLSPLWWLLSKLRGRFYADTPPTRGKAP